MPNIIHIVEPTLTNEAGHCLSFVTTLADASPSTRIFLWVNHRAKITSFSKNIELKKYFFRKIRKIQCYFLYKKLLNTKEKIFISTASQLDLSTFNFAAKRLFPSGKVPENKVYFYFHWINNSHKKLTRLKSIALQQPNFMILGTTPTVIELFKQAGFKHAEVAPYPISIPATNLKQTLNFEKVLFAGAARQDKGFRYVVDLVEYVTQHHLEIPFLIQSSAEHFHKYDAATKADIVRLNGLANPHLEICTETLETSRYLSNFSGAICLQVYDPNDFSDRISGVTLDALSAGSPVLALANTWISRQVLRFNAGIVVNRTDPETLIHSLIDLIANYSKYSQNALDAGRILQKEHSAQQLAHLLFTN
jgi:glycosyltransferase involved in cell wall biosynthesis